VLAELQMQMHAQLKTDFRFRGRKASTVLSKENLKMDFEAMDEEQVANGRTGGDDESIDGDNDEDEDEDKDEEGAGRAVVYPHLQHMWQRAKQRSKQRSKQQSAQQQIRSWARRPTKLIPMISPTAWCTALAAATANVNTLAPNLVRLKNPAEKPSIKPSQMMAPSTSSSSSSSSSTAVAPSTSKSSIKSGLVTGKNILNTGPSDEDVAIMVQQSGEIHDAAKIAEEISLVAANTESDLVSGRQVRGQS
jgi:hypothetical protein